LAAGGTRPSGKRLAIVCAILLTGVAALSGLPAQARSEVRPPPFVGGHYDRLQAARVVTLGQLGRRPATSNASVPNHAVTRHAKSYANTPATAPRALSPQPLVPQGSVEEQLTVFPGVSVTSGKNALGTGQNTEPPDTQIAVGPDKIVEMVNNNVTVWSKSGAWLSIADLQTFYPVPAGFNVTDPRVLYDAASGRFFATAFALDIAYDSRVYLAVSQTSDPNGAWSQWVIRSTGKTITDQPKIGVSDDKVAVSWAEGVPPPCQGQSATICFTGEVTVVVQKSEVIAVPPAALPHTFLLGPDLERFGIAPVQSMSPTTTQYLVYNNADPYFGVENRCAQAANAFYGTCPTLGIIAVTGTPAAGNIALLETDPAINSTTAPPDAPQVGTSAMLATGDDRMVSAVYQNNRIWATATNGNNCSTPNPITNPPGACLLALQAATDQAGFPVQSWTFGSTGDYVFYPAIGLDVAGDPFMVFSRSNSTIHPGAWMTGQSGANNPWTAWSAIAPGAGTYDSQTGCGGRNRWGDYSGAATDPTNPTDVWVAGEYAESGATTCLWATSIARLTYSQPTVATVTAQTGSAGTSVTITGTDFLSGNTIVYFGANPATAVSVQTPNRLTATAPSGSGLVYLSAATADGHGPNGAQFKYPRAEAGAPLASPHTGPVRGTAPPRVPPSTAGTRPLVPEHPLSTQQIPSPSGGGQGGGSVALGYAIRLIWADLLSAFRILIR
jgi:hypothetical protein